MIRRSPTRSAQLQRPLVIALVSCLMTCTNYSAQNQTINPPILASISPEGTGHIITLYAQNTEIGFAGYRLFQSSSDTLVRNADPLSGVDCSRPLAVPPNQAITYVIEVKPGQTAVSPGYSNRLCVVSLLLTSGTFVALRSLSLSGLTSVDTSLSSNSLVVP